MSSQYDLYRATNNRAMTAIYCMRDALDEKLGNEYLDLSAESLRPITWPSTLPMIDTHCDGFYGLTVFAAEKGTGKTMLAVSSAIEAASCGEWHVVYFLAEDDADGFRERFNTYLNAHPESAENFGNFSVIQVGKNQTPRDLKDEIASAVDWTVDLPILIVIDSINTVVNLGTGNYLRQIQEFGIWAMLSRRLSRGLVSFMLTTEANKRGESKGEALPYWADVYVQMKKKSDSVVEFTLAKTRRTGGEGTMINYRRNWDQGCFVSNSPYTQFKRENLKVVDGGANDPPTAFGLGDEDDGFGATGEEDVLI